MPIRSLKDLYTRRGRGTIAPPVFKAPEALKAQYEKCLNYQNFCEADAPTAHYICTREKGHDGPHEAHWEPGAACCPPWS